MRIFYVILFCIFGIVFGYWINTLRSTKRDDSVLIVGTTGAYAPFVSINEQGEYEGFDVDVARALAQQLGKTLEIKDLGSMTSLFMGLEQGKIDAIIWGLSIIPERLLKVTMVSYAGELIDSYKLVFWNNIPEGIKSIEDLAGKIVCVEGGSAQEKVLSAYPKVIQKPMEKVVDSLMELQYRKADAAFIEPAVAKKFQDKFKEIKMLDVPLGKEDQELGTGIAIKKDNLDFIKQVEQAVASLKKVGTLKQLEEKWGIY
jgi:ABC-type amino acid transport substrate-binding protein